LQSSQDFEELQLNRRGGYVMRGSLEGVTREAIAEVVANGSEAAQLPDVALREVQEFMVNELRGQPVRIYEAGGGSLSIVPLASLNNPVISVVDIDETQLRNNRYAGAKIHGDIQTYVFPPDSFDLVVCHNVIEHLPSVDKAILRFHDALRPGGLLFIGAPNPASLFGLATKYSPHWFHVWFYRVILRDKDAGKPGRHPFRTVYHPIVSPKALLEFCAQVGLEPIYFNLYIGKNYMSLRETRPLIGRALGVALGLMNALTFGRLKLAHGDYHAVFRKSATPASGSSRVGQ
jgi:SAM-dependent methyltransferase